MADSAPWLKYVTPAGPAKLDVSKYAGGLSDPSTWDKRADGTAKGNGFLGVLKRPDGKVSSEISVGVDINGKETEIPTIVPTLSQSELDYLMTNPVGEGHQIPKPILDKAIAYAKQRMATGKSPFADATPAEGPWTKYASPPGKENSPPAAPQQSVGDRLLSGAKELGGEALRAGSEAITSLPLMAADVPVAVGNLIKGRDKGGNYPYELPSAAQQRRLDAAIPAPTSTAGKASEAVSSLLMGGGANAGRRAAGFLTPAERAAAALPQAAPKAAAPMVDTARQAGYVLKPSEAGGKVGKVIEGLTGSPKLSVDASIKNQRVTNRLAAEEIGVKGKLTKGSIAQAKKPHNSVYQEMGELGEIATDPAYAKEIASIGRTPGTSFSKAVNPDLEKLRDAYTESRFNAKDAVLKIRELRAAATKNMKAPNAPTQNELGHAQKEIADAIEGQMERHATSVGQADLVSRFRSARQSLAKIHSVEAAIKGNTGEVSAPALARQLDRKVPLSGRLKTIADVANEFGEVTREGTKLKNKVPVTVLEGLPALAGAALTASEHPGVGLPLMAGVAGRPLARKALLSNAYQNRLATQAPKSGTAGKDLVVGGLGAAPGQVDQNGIAQ